MEKVKVTKQQIEALAEAFGKSTKTIYRWVAKDDIRLTSRKAEAILNTIPEPENPPA